ncbi:MAG: ankyrin repeat domain-containing protein [Gemmatimonadota bacterium]
MRPLGGTANLTRTVGLLGLAVLLLGLSGLETPVADAAQRGDLDAVKELLRAGADVNAAQGDGMTALHWAAERGDVSLAEVLLYAGADVDAGTRIGHYRPLHLAAQSGDADMLRMLLAARADPEAATSNSGARPLHLAAASGSAAAVQVLIDAGAGIDARESAWGQTPLIFAAAAGRVEVIRALLKAGADPGLAAWSVDTAEQEAADRAAERRLQQVLAEFKEREGGGPGWQPTPRQVQAAIDVYREVQRRWPDVPDPAEEERQKAEAQKKTESEDAQEEGSAAPDSVAAADSVASPPGQRPESDDASAEDSAAAVRADSAKAEEPKPLTYGQLVHGWGGLTPLLHAVRQGHTDAVLALLEGGADINQPSEGDHTSPLLMAAINGQFDLSLLLLGRGADPNLASTAGATPLFAVLERTWAPRASYAHPVEHQQQRVTHLDVMKALLDAGADPNARLTTHLWYMEYTFSVLGGSGINLQGATPFWRAAYALDVDAMRLLKSYGADPDIPTTKPPERRRRAQDEEEKPAEEGESADSTMAGGVAVDADDASARADSAAAAVESSEGGAPLKANAEGESAHEEEAPAGEEEDEDKDYSGVPPVPVGGPAIYPIHAASGVGYGQSFAGNAHRHVPDNWLAAIKFLVEECGADVNVRDANAYTALHHAASRGDSELVRYLVEQGADVTVVSRKGQTTADMANGPVQRVQPFPETVQLLESMGSKNNHKCVSC